jgi:hypothetical protein
MFMLIMFYIMLFLAQPVFAQDVSQDVTVVDENTITVPQSISTYKESCENLVRRMDAFKEQIKETNDVIAKLQPDIDKCQANVATIQAAVDIIHGKNPPIKVPGTDTNTETGTDTGTNSNTNTQ